MTGEEREAEIRRVLDWLDEHGYKLSTGWGRDGEPAYHTGHRERRLIQRYAEGESAR